MDLKAIFIVAVALLLGANAQQQHILQCDFVDDEIIGYTCWMQNANATDLSMDFVISGTHLQGRGNADVINVEVMNSQFTSIPLAIFDTFPNLEFLDVSGNNIEILEPLRNCENLQGILLNSNRILSIPANTFAACQNLLLLQLTGNRVAHFNSTGLENLIDLNLGNNDISEFEENSFEMLRSLEELFLNNNNIREIVPENFAGLQNLRELYLPYNNLVSLNGREFSSLPQLRILSLYRNQIREIAPLQGIPNLDQIDMGSNEIEDFNMMFSQNENLTVILADGNRLTRLQSRNFQNNPNLVVIFLQGNRIDTIEEGVFSHLNQLRTIRLTNNICIDLNFDITGDLAVVEEFLKVCLPRDSDTLVCLFQEVAGVGYTCFIEGASVGNIPVQFAGDHIENRTDDDVARVFFQRSTLTRLPNEMFQQFFNLHTVDVSGSGLRSINALRYCDNLLNLYASFNEIEVVETNTFLGCSHLSRLVLSNNLISEFHAGGLENLRELRLDSNRIERLSNDTFGPLASLEVLWLSRNNISFVFPELMLSLRNLVELYLGANRLPQIFAGELLPLINLRRLSLYQNQIASIHEDGFLGLTSLRELDLGENQITDLGNIFRQTPALQNLELDNNNIERLNAGVFANNTDLVQIDLHGNRIRVVEDGVFENLIHLREINLLGNACVDEDFNIDAPGNLDELLQALQQCRETTPNEIRMDCQFSQHDVGYTCWIINVMMDEDVRVVIGTDNHVPGFTNANVDRVAFLQARLTRVPLEIFTTFENLTMLDVSGTGLEHINPLRNCARLNTFYASFNEIEVVDPYVFADCANLVRMQLSNNRIREFHSNGLSNVTFLNLNRNQLSEVQAETFTFLRSVETLWLSNNQFTTFFPVMFMEMTRLRELLLNSNQIRELIPEEFSTLENLEILSLYGNQIDEVSDVAFDNLNSLRELDLGNNRLSMLGTPFAVLANLQLLFLDNNQLSRINNNLFRNNTNLLEIELHYNNISVIEPDTFNHLQRLDVLTLRRNGCINEDFFGIRGNFDDVLPLLENCLPAAAVGDMVCTFDTSARGYSCRVGNETSFMLRSIRFQ